MQKMLSIKPSTPLRSYWAFFILALLLIVVVHILYGVNIARWRNSPDFGWRTLYNSGPNVVAETFQHGEAAGLRVGDTIRAINGKVYITFDELFLSEMRQTEPGSVNTYTVIRNGKELEIDVTTGRLGLSAVLWRSGTLFAIGFIYILIGALVFLMKPKALESRLFFAMTCLIGLTVSYIAPSDLMHPLWLYDIRLSFELLFPSSMIHLAFRFPKTHTFLRKRPWLPLVPYLISFLLFVLIKATSTAYWNTPPILNLLQATYTMMGILVFLIFSVRNLLTDSSLIVRLQSRVIFLGILLAFFVPIADVLSRSLWQISLIPSTVPVFALFLSVFPLSIGYTIVKHDLFAIDVMVRRTYGYVLSTAAIIGAYALMVAILNLTFRTEEVSRSPLFSIGFALAVVFLFEPMHKRFQNFVDRLFYRQQYDYRKTIQYISEAMTSMLDADLIRRTLIGSLVKEMVLENGVLLLADLNAQGYHTQVVEGAAQENLAAAKLNGEDALLRVIQEEDGPILQHDIDLNPRYEQNRPDLQRTFEAFSSAVMVPMKYKGEMRGIISLGKKKSGKMLTPEDLDLLKTMTNQSAIALENAKLFEENLEKGRLEEELKIAHDIQVSMLPEKAPEIEGFKIAARSIPAKEVGGDFYDFIELGRKDTGNKLGIVIGDVSGKGVSGALLMAASRSTYRVLAEAHASVEEVMRMGNHRLNSDIRKGMFVALLYAVLDLRERTLTLSNAGQTQPILCSGGTSKAFYIDTDGDRFPLGIVKDCDYQSKRLILKEGDAVVFYTDGVVEAMNGKGELFGFERLMTSIEEGRGLDANDLLDKIMDDVSRYVDGGEQHDDLTIVSMKVK